MTEKWEWVINKIASHLLSGMYIYFKKSGIENHYNARVKAIPTRN
jgi:hypothetical protein